MMKMRMIKKWKKKW